MRQHWRLLWVHHRDKLNGGLSVVAEGFGGLACCVEWLWRVLIACQMDLSGYGELLDCHDGRW